MKQNELKHRQKQNLNHPSEDWQVDKAEPKLRRLTLYVTDRERESLTQIVEDEGYGESVRQLLECFIADLTNSERRGWPWGKQGAQEWLDAHRSGCQMESRKS